MGSAIGGFNQKMIEYLEAFSSGLDRDLFSDIRCFQLAFSENGETVRKTECATSEMVPSESYIDYYWTEFVYVS